MADRDTLKREMDPDRFSATFSSRSEEWSAAGSGHHHGGSVVDVRAFHHHGHDVVVRTSYEILVDGTPFDASISVADDGHVSYHGLPTQPFGSVVDLVRAALDVFGAEGLAAPAPAPDGHHDHQHDHHHGTGR